MAHLFLPIEQNVGVFTAHTITKLTLELSWEDREDTGVVEIEPALNQALLAIGYREIAQVIVILYLLILLLLLLLCLLFLLLLCLLLLYLLLF